MKYIIKESIINFFGSIFRIFKWCYSKKTYNEYRKKYDIDETFRFNGEGIMFYGDGKIVCGANSYIGRFSSVQSIHPNKVIIGKNCAISNFVRIYTKNNKRGDVIIKDNCWICSGVFIREGITIGSNSVVGANSVVVDDIPNNCIASGAPAKIKKRNMIIPRKKALKTR
jgi:maltose O-acetyltransferase